MELKVEQGNKSGQLVINAYNLFELLTSEDQEILLRDMSRQTIIFEELEDQISTGLSTPNFNSKIFDLRQKLITEHMGSIIAEWASAIISKLTKAVENERLANKDYWELYRYVKENYMFERYDKNMPEKDRADYGDTTIYANDIADRVLSLLEIAKEG